MIEKKVHYSVYREVGMTQVIVINSSNRNIEYLKTLGQQLKEDNKLKNIAAVYVFDNEKAADLYGKFEDFSSKKEEDFYDNHFIASYNRNIYTNYNRFFIHLPKNEGGELEQYFPLEINYSGINKFNDYLENQKRFHQNNTIVYHYTSLNSLIEILKTNSLWATNCQYLNDVLELKHIIPVLNSLSDELNGVELSISKELINLFQSKIHSDFSDKNYFISFSNEKNSVAMWRNYGNNGIIMGFDFSSFYLNKDTKKTKIERNGKLKFVDTAKLLSDIIYDKLIIKDMFRSFINITATKIKSNKSSELFQFLGKEINDSSYLYLLSILYKDKSYKYENEVRMAFCLGDNQDIGSVENFRVNNNLLIPYLNISFEENGKLPLKSIGINPGNNDKMLKKSINLLLKSNGYNDVEVYEPKVKIR